MAISRVQYPTPYASSAKQTTHTLAWSSTTAAGSLLLACVGWNEEASTVTAAIAGGSGSWVPLAGTPVERAFAGSGQLKGAIYYKQNAAAQSGNVTVTLSAAHHCTIHLVEYSGVVPSGGPDKTATSSGNGTAPVSGTTATTTTANELWAGFIVVKNVNAETAPTGGFSQVGETGQSTGGGGSERSGYYEKIVTGTGAAGVGCTVSAGVDYVGMIATFAQANTASNVQWTASGAAAAGPQQFPLGPPDMSGATTITDANPDAFWTPTHPGDAANAGLRSGVDYIISAPAQRTRGITIKGGRNVFVPKLLITYGTTADNPMVNVQGGDLGRIIHIDTCHLQPNNIKQTVGADGALHPIGNQCDAFKSHDYDGRHLQIRNCIVEKLFGQFSQVHCDVFQPSGGCGDLWVEDFTSSSTYDGFMMQREANLETQSVHFSVTGASSAGGNYTYTTSAAHGYSVGDPISVYHPTGGSSAYYGGYTILSTTTFTFTCKRGDTASPPAIPSGSRCARMTFAYDVGSINLNRVNHHGYHNDLSNTDSLQCIRFGARTAPKPNDGGTLIGGYPVSHVNDDGTPLTTDWWDGTLTATNWYAEPDAGNIGQFVQPDTNSSNYSVIRPVFHAAAGGNPAYADWPLHPTVSAGTKIQQGPPPGGDYVTMQGGLPTPRVVTPGGSGINVHAAVLDAAFSVTTSANYPNAYDTFTRIVGAGGLGSADLGGAYTLTGTAGDFSANGSQAVVAVTAAAQTKRAVLASIAMTNQYAAATMQTDTQPAGSYTAFDVYVRYVDANNWYRARVLLNAAGAITIRWDRNLASVLTTIKAAAATGLTAQTVLDYGIIATAVGTAPTVLSAYVFDASSPPPLPIPAQASVNDTSSALQVVSAAGFGCALDTGSTATATHVAVAEWSVFPVRWTSSGTGGVQIADPPISVPTFAPPGTGTKHRWTPR